MEVEKSKRIRLAWRLVFFGLLLFISWAALQPISGTTWFPGQDKIVHASAYVVLYGLGWLAFPGKGFRGYLFGGLLGFGVMIEVLQHFTGYRFLEFLDVVANTFGLLLGGVGICVCQRFLPGTVLALSGIQASDILDPQQQKEYADRG